jgi:hypothetical protein
MIILARIKNCYFNSNLAIFTRLPWSKCIRNCKFKRMTYFKDRKRSVYLRELGDAVRPTTLHSVSIAARGVRSRCHRHTH